MKRRNRNKPTSLPERIAAAGYWIDGVTSPEDAETVQAALAEQAIDVEVADQIKRRLKNALRTQAGREFLSNKDLRTLDELPRRAS